MSATELATTCMELDEALVSTAEEERLPRGQQKAKPTFPLRLPRTMRAEAAELACLEGVSLNQLIVEALAEKIARVSFFYSSRERRPKTARDLEQVKAV